MQQPGISRPATVFYALCKVGDLERDQNPGTLCQPASPRLTAYKHTITIGDNVSTAWVRGRTFAAGESSGL
jgi:hypothetical protein